MRNVIEYIYPPQLLWTFELTVSNNPSSWINQTNILKCIVYFAFCFNRPVLNSTWTNLKPDIHTCHWILLDRRPAWIFINANIVISVRRTCLWRSYSSRRVSTPPPVCCPLPTSNPWLPLALSLSPPAFRTRFLYLPHHRRRRRWRRPPGEPQSPSTRWQPLGSRNPGFLSQSTSRSSL